MTLWLAGAVRSNLYAQPSVLTWHNDNARTGQNLQETALTPANVNASTFGRLFTLSVDGKVDAQPLYVPSLAIPGQGTHNVLLVATEHDSVYAFDADTGTPLWHVSMLVGGEAVSDDRGCGQVTPEIGVTSTPVIDPLMGPHGTMYVVAMSKNGSIYHQRLHALDLTTGGEQFGGPIDVAATYPNIQGTITFDPKQYKERAGLALYNGVVYTSWASHCDFQPYSAWVIGYNESTLSQTSVLNLTPNGSEGSVWAAGAGPAVDSSGNIYLLMANGTFETTLVNGFPNKSDYGNAFVKIASGNTSVADYFTMSNTVSESNADQDLGSGGAMLLPPLNNSQGQSRDLAVGAGKDHHIYVVDRSNMGKFLVSPTYQDLASSLSGSVFSSPAWFNGTLYYGAVGDRIKAFPFAGGLFATTASSQSPTGFGYPGSTPSISANGTANGIVWAAENANPAVLHAYDAANLASEIYNSNMAANNRDHFGAGNKFIVPTVVNGKVYVGATNGVGAFGFLCGTASVPIPANNAAGVALSPTLSWTAATGATSYDVALSTANPPGLVATGLAGASYPVTGPLASGTKYYWYVVTHNCSGASQSPVWSFTTTGGSGQETGFVDMAGDTQGGTTLVTGATLFVRGWAADTATGAPVQSVTVLVDGIGAGNATLGISRPDVAQAYNRSDFTNSGWSFQMSTAALSVGQHAVTASAMGASGTGPLTRTRTVTITMTSGQEIGFVDMAGDAQGGGTVAQAGTLYVRGWAADTSTGAPVQTVTVLIDGNSVGNATLGGARPDVASAYSRSDYTNSGWSFQMSAGTLSVGPHSVTAMATGSSGTGTLTRTRTVNIASGQEIGFVDMAGDVQGGATVTQGGTLYVRGWAADTSSGAPVQSVTVFVDGNSVGTATLGGSRPDVASAYSRSDYTNSGWTFQMSAGTLSVGQHTVTAIAAGSSGTAMLVGSRTINVTAGQEIGFVDMAGDVQGGISVSQGGTLYVRGWAADTVSGAPVTSVTVFIDGTSRGNAALGVSRPDVASAYSRSDFTNSGWSFQMSAAGLSVGQHSVSATASGPSGTGTLTHTQTVNITP